MQGNVLSSLVLFAWVPIALWIGRRWPRPKAALLLLLLPVMFLPERVNFKLTGLPEFDKGRIAALWALIVALLFYRERLLTFAAGRGVKIAVFLIIVGGWLTVFMNFDPIVDGSNYRPGHELDDLIHVTVINGLQVVVPFLLAAAIFRDSTDLRVFFRVIVGATLVYSLFQLFEMRMSPQLHRWLYGFHAHDFGQAMRQGGFRPTVFMEHGLAVVMFTLAGTLAAAGARNVDLMIGRVKPKWAVTYLWFVLILSKSAAALLYSLVTVPLVLFGSPKARVRVALTFGILVIAYPVVRGAGLVPVDRLSEIVTEQFGEDRAASMMVRLVNEERLLERASERPNFGWGSYCRPCLFDPTTGRQMSVSDGDWIITRGMYGRVGFLGKYLLLLLPIVLCARRLRFIRNRADRELLSTLALIAGVSAFDLLPNGNFNYLVFVYAGVLFGCTGGILQQQQAQRAKAIKRKRALDAGVQPIPAGAH